MPAKIVEKSKTAKMSAHGQKDSPKKPETKPETKKSETKKSVKPSAKDEKKETSKSTPASSKPSSKVGMKAVDKAPETPAVRKETASGDLNGKSPYSKEELKEWRQILIQKRNEACDDIGSLQQGAMDLEDGHIAPTHQADRGSDADLQDLNLRLASDEKQLVWQIDRALRKIDRGLPLAFGLCEHTKKPVAKARLQMLPWTPLSIEGCQYMEENGLPLEDVILDD
jgi:RNA polymerase-binding transcription factor DksA